MKIGIVGFGRLAQYYYAPALRSMSRQLEICVADPLESSRRAAVKAFPHSTCYPGHREMLESEALHAVLVATPPSTHLAIWRSIEPLELPVFMEKPFLLAREIDDIDPADPAWARLMVNFNRRFWPEYSKLGRVIAGGVLGRIKGARFVLHVNPRKWSQISNHRSGPEEGGVLYDLGSQMVDLVLTSFPQSPVEITVKRCRASVAEEQIDLKLHFSDGVTVSCDLAYGRRNRESVFVEGENASLHLRDPNALCWAATRRSTPGRLFQTAADLAVWGYRGIFRSQSMLRFSICRALDAFFEALGTSRPFSPGFGDALRVARCLKAAADLLAGRPMPIA